MRRSWGLRGRVLAAAAAIAVVSLATFGVLLHALESQSDLAARSRATTDALAEAGELQRLALGLETGVRGYALTRDTTFLTPYDEARRAIPATGAKLAALQHDPAKRRLVAHLRADLAAYADGYLAPVVAAVRRGSPQAGSSAATQAGRARFDALQAQFTRLRTAEQAEQARDRARSSMLRRRAVQTAVGGLVVLLALIVLLALGAVRAIVAPVGRLQRFARELGAGRFSARLPESGPPETAELAHAFNETAANLAAAEAELRRISERHLAELDAVFREAPLGLAFVDRELRFLRVNEALAAMTGVPGHRHLGRHVGELIIAGGLVESALREVIEAGDAVIDRDVSLGARTFMASAFPVADDDDELLAVGLAMTDVTERRRAEDARARMEAATAALAAAVSVAEVARATVEEAGRALGTAGAVLLLLERGGDRLRLVEAHGLSAAAGERWAEIPLDTPVLSTAVMHAGEAIYVHGEAELLRRWPALRGATTAPGSQGYAALPLTVSGRTLGVLSLAFAQEMTFDEPQRALLGTLATQCAVALARAQLYEREHMVAQTLQASLLPRALPQIPGLDLAGRLEAGAPGLDVGGDFYDAFAIGDGVWGLAIGDVCGKGVDAAALTALARHTVRAAAQAGGSPAAVLEALNRAALAEVRPGQFLTAVFAWLTARPGGRFELVLACGGHLPPVVLDAHARPRALACAGTLLGVVEDPELTDVTLLLEPGDMLALYTDGLTEAGAPAHTLSTEEVAALLAEVRAGTAEQTAEACLYRAVQAGGGHIRDDIAVLVARVLAPV